MSNFDLRAFWRERLAQGIPRTTWSGRPRDRRETTPQTVVVEPPAGLVARVEAVVRGAPFLRYVTALASAAMVLHRASGETRLVVASPRRRYEQTLGGDDAVLLVLDVDPSASFHDLLRGVRQACLDTYAHQDYSMMALRADLPDPSVIPFEVALSASDVHGQLPPLGPELSVEWGADLVARVTFDPGRVSERSARRFARLAARALDTALADPTSRWATHAWADDDDRAEVLRIGAGEGPWGPATQTLQEAVFAHPPESPALVYQDRVTTYGELRRRARRLAQRLLAAELRPGSPVAVFADRSPDTAVAQLGIMAAGGVYVPIDPTLPVARREQMLAELAPSFTIADPSRPAGRAALALDDGADDGPPLPEVAPSAPAYAIYTSGSTGGPKAVMLAHDGLVRLLEDTRRFLEIGPSTTVLQYATPIFDASIWQLHMGLFHGARVILVPEDVYRSPTEVAALARKHRVEVADLAPMLLASIEPSDIPTLRAVSTGGERCTPDTRRRWSSAARFFNVYGPTEATVASTYAEVRPEDAADTSVIGRPMAHVRAYVVDDALRLVPVGIAGELVLGGQGVGLGYLARPELTAEKFLPDPFVGPPARMYRSGDRARWRDDGGLELLGRDDAQVKVRGFRVELAEVEAALLAIPEVTEAAVILRQDRLIGYVTARAATDDGKLRRALTAALPSYMVPSSLVVLPAFPRLPNQKVDRAKLPDPTSDGPYVAPRTADEQVIAGVWSSVLGVERPGIHDNFFQLGGHSLLVTRAAARITQLLGVDIPLPAFFEHPTIAELSVVVEQRRLAAADPERLARLLDEAEAMGET